MSAPIFRHRHTTTDHNWRAEAICAQVGDHELWYPTIGQSTTAAKRVCGGCPVRVACLDDALRTGDRHGIRGGLTATERARTTTTAA